MDAICKISSMIDSIYLSQSTPSNPKAVYTRTPETGENSGGEYDVFVDGKIVPYNVFYQAELAAITTEFQKLSDELFLSHHPDAEYIAKLLRARKRACADNDRMGLEETRIEHSHDTHQIICNIGPIESYSDRCGGRKRFFTFVRVEKKSELTDIVIQTCDIAKRLESNANIPNLNIAPRVSVAIGDVLERGGEDRKLVSSGRSRPEDPNLISRYGTIKQIFANKTQQKIQDTYIPLVPGFFKHGIITGDVDKIAKYLQKNYRYDILCHEIGHAIIRPFDYMDRVGDTYYNFFEEFRADVLGIKITLEMMQAGLLPSSHLPYKIACGLISSIYFRNLHIQKGERSAYKYLAPLRLTLSGAFNTGTFYITFDKIFSDMHRVVQFGQGDDFIHFLESFMTPQIQYLLDTSRTFILIGK